MDFDQKKVFSLQLRLDLKRVFFLRRYRFNLLGLIGFFIKTQWDKWFKNGSIFLFYFQTQLHRFNEVCYLQINYEVH